MKTTRPTTTLTITGLCVTCVAIAFVGNSSGICMYCQQSTSHGKLVACGSCATSNNTCAHCTNPLTLDPNEKQVHIVALAPGYTWAHFEADLEAWVQEDPEREKAVTIGQRPYEIECTPAPAAMLRGFACVASITPKLRKTT